VQDEINQVHYVFAFTKSETPLYRSATPAPAEGEEASEGESSAESKTGKKDAEGAEKRKEAEPNLATGGWQLMEVGVAYKRAIL
jgi:hypothetical protein